MESYIITFHWLLPMLGEYTYLGVQLTLCTTTMLVLIPEEGGGHPPRAKKTLRHFSSNFEIMFQQKKWLRFVIFHGLSFWAIKVFSKFFCGGDGQLAIKLMTFVLTLRCSTLAICYACWRKACWCCYFHSKDGGWCDHRDSWWKRKNHFEMF